MLLGLVLSLRAYSSEPIPTYVFRDDTEEIVRLGDSVTVLNDSSRQYTIQSLLNSSDADFQPASSASSTVGAFVGWFRIQLVNNSHKARHYYFEVHAFADSAWVYTVHDGKMVGEELTGAAIDPVKKIMRFKYNYIPFSLEAGASRVYYFRTVFTGDYQFPNWQRLTLVPGQPIVKRTIEAFSTQFFYAGIMLLFCFVSFFMFGMFRERVFVYFAFLVLSFIVFFMHQNWVLGTFLSYQSSARDFIIGQGASSGILVFMFLFVSQYLQLPKNMPVMYRVFGAFTVFGATIIHIVKLLGFDVYTARWYFNFLLLGWIVMIFAIILYLVKKKDKSARILLVSSIILIVGAVLDSLSLMELIPANAWTFRNSFQFGTVLFSGVLFYGLFDKINAIRQQKQQLEELDKLKSRFFANISHEFRTPLTLMMGPLQQVLEKTTDPTDQELLKMAQRNAQRQLRLVNQLLDLSKLEAGKMTLQASEEDFLPFLKGVLHSYDSLASQKHISMKLDCLETDFPLHFDRDKMEKIFYNLLSNAFKFTEPGGQVSIQLKKENNWAVIAITDTGKGISSKDLPHIFDRFFQADLGRNDVQEGSGIGLPLTKELVQLHSGTIEVESRVGKGATFRLRFPMGSQHLQPSQIVPLNPAQKLGEPVEKLTPILEEAAPQETTGNTRSAQRILIVEDNDDVRFFIRQRLEPTYRTIEAKDGEEGIRKAIDKLPDLIISDVMMPKRDGHEVCATLKTDIRTSHIPIILLTAKAALEEKLEGLGTGADDYLVKPFDSKELLVRVQNLIQSRQQLRERFAAAISLKPSEISTNSVDKAFLEKALQIVEANMSNESFDLETLAHDIGMSRPNLNRKLRALLNQSTNQFIQSVRLQRAADLLRQNAGTVSEIAFETGFGSVAYFVKCFKGQFGATPGNYLKTPE
ncbi:MAG: response regulator [Saprospiraceae bacterium]|nr:response regulator [Saprospiraceae bacterium]MCF8248659.1 response regulator [Saprospiraceae bacterium]MCF8278851.1 response regulator [Bacteroidales bacterium]MCF8310651.1 response regulator [Saprospiraceae bacterium]MCF8439210.1 response regulator [Saprospiraceae bacterium]